MFTVVYETQDEVVAEEEFNQANEALLFAILITTNGAAKGDWAEVRSEHATIQVIEGDVVDQEEEG